MEENIAKALLHGQAVESLQDGFQFEAIPDPNAASLTEAEKLHLTTILQTVTANVGKEAPLRAFRREVPFVSGQVKGSAPDWARGAKIAKTIGPVIDKYGRKYWWDLYHIVPSVQLFLSGATTPAVVLSLKVSNHDALLHHHKDYTIPLSSIWIASNLFTPSAPANEYCGLTLKKGTIHFSNDVILSAGKMTAPPATVITLTLDLAQQTDVSVSPDTTGIDPKNASIQLPQKLVFQFSDAGTSACGGRVVPA